ncbi:MAG TPA: hypothetical protein DCQ50_01600 [Chryseobacterium sp.]|nr:hypothetical protein [Chryseobacterium sp.]
MTNTSFALIIIAAYFFYYTVIILMDAAKFSKSAVATADTKQDFVIPQVQQAPVKVVIARSTHEDMPQLDGAEDDDKPEPANKAEQTENAGTNVFDALGIETITEEEVIEVDAEALNFMLS